MKNHGPLPTKGDESSAGLVNECCCTLVIGVIAVAIAQAKELPEVPTSLRAAIDTFSASEFVTETLGPQVQQHYANFFEKEQKAFDSVVTDWERRQYFEQI